MLVQEVLQVAEHRSIHPDRPHSYVVNPPVELVHVHSGKKVLVDAVDVKGLSPQTVHVIEVKSWLPASRYELPILHDPD